MTSIDKFHAALVQLAATPSKLDKLEIVKGFDPIMLAMAKRALDPTTPTYIAKLALPATFGTKDLGVDEVELLDQLCDRRLTGNAALDAVNAALANLTEKSATVLQRLILKDLRAGIGASTVNKAFPGTVPEFAYMRCSLPKDAKLAEWPWADGVYSQLKADGMFARIAVDIEGMVLVTSRQGLTFPAASLKPLTDAARATFAPGTETHGELTVWFDGKVLHRKDGNGILNSLQDGAELPAGHEVRYDAWDQIPLDLAVPDGHVRTPYSKRLSNLSFQIQNGAAPQIQLIEYKVVRSYADASAHFREMLLRGLEGTVVKHPDMQWRDGDSKQQVKFKLEFTVDLRIKGFRPGEPGKRTEATFGSLICETLDGQLEVGVSGLKRDMEMHLHENRESALGWIVAVRANDIVMPSESSELHALSHPRFIELRKDKVVADSLEQVLAQHRAAVEGKELACSTQ